MVWTKTLLLQTRVDNHENQKELQILDIIIAGFEIFYFLIETRKATGFKSLQVNCWEINQVTSEY